MISATGSILTPRKVSPSPLGRGRGEGLFPLVLEHPHPLPEGEGMITFTFPPDTICARRLCAAAPMPCHATQSRRSGGRTHGAPPAGPYGRFVPPARSSALQR